MQHKIKLHQRFFDVFTKEELEDLIKLASIVIEEVIIINTKDYFFEISADIGNELDLYCYNNITHKEKKLTKDEFMHLLKSSPIQEINFIDLDD